jgi:hypothetical protein
MGYLELGLGDLRDLAHRMVKGDNFGALIENVVACGCDWIGSGDGGSR